MGFVLLGIATLTPAGINGALYGNVAHGVITGLLFFLVGVAEVALRDGGPRARSAAASTPARPGSARCSPSAAVASLGLPGLAGFWGEFLAMTGAFEPAAALDRGLFLTLMAIAGVGTVLTAAYLLVMVRRVCMGPGPRAPRSSAASGRSTVLTWAPLVVAIVLLGRLAEGAARAHRPRRAPAAGRVRR